MMYHSQGSHLGRFARVPRTMDIFKGAERLMGMEQMTWASHANPLSVYSRAAGAPLVFFAAWSAFWIGWYSLLPIAAAMLWIWMNPRLFSPPSTTSSWATKGVLGERAYINRNDIPIPEHHRKAVTAIMLFSGVFFSVGAYGFFIQDFWAAFGGYHGVVLAKIWFVDRMVWVWEDMKNAHSVYQSWNDANWDATFSE